MSMPKRPLHFEKAVKDKDWELLNALLSEDLVNQLEYGEKENLAVLFFEKGDHLLSSASDLSSIQAAFSAFEKSLRLDMSSTKSWIKFAEAHLKLGILQEDEEMILRANELFDQADELHKSRGKKLPATALWDWGVCLYLIARKSEEALDFRYALDKYAEAYQEGLEESSFLLDYGTAMGEMGVITGKPELVREAACHLEKSIEAGRDFSITRLRLASAYKVLYLWTGDLGYFEKADQSFVAAIRLQEDSFDLWLNWGQLLVYEGKLSQDSSILMEGLEKLGRANQKKPDDQLVYIGMGETLIQLGIVEDRLDYFKDAEGLLKRARELFPSNIEVISSLGHCLVEMGKYLSDEKVIYKGIETFRIGLCFDKKAYFLWHGLAISYFMLAEISSDFALYEKSAKLSLLAISLREDLPDYWNDCGIALMKLGELTGESRYIAAAIEKFEGAIHAFNRKSSALPDPDWFYNYGCALDWLGDFELNPHYFERAISILSRLYEQYPHLHYIRYNLALALYHLGDSMGDVELLENAIHHFLAFIEDDPEDDGAILDCGLTFLTLADLLQEAISNQRSIDCFLQAEKYLIHAIALGNTRANYYVACLHALRGEVDPAVCYLERARLQNTLPVLRDLLEDEWLDPIRDSEPFKAFLKNVSG